MAQMTVKNQKGKSENRSYEAIPSVIMGSDLIPHDLGVIVVYMCGWSVRMGRSGSAAGNYIIT